MLKPTHQIHPPPYSAPLMYWVVLPILNQLEISHVQSIQRIPHYSIHCIQ